MKKITLPEIGDGIAGGTVVSISVKAGDTINVGDGLFELETDKAVVEIPSKETGVILKILFKEGDQINVGDSIFELDSKDGGDEPDNTATEKVETEAKLPERSEPVTPMSTPSPSSTASGSSSSSVIKLPEIGDGIAGGTVVSISVKTGDTINVGDGLFELETDKAVVEIPSKETGVVLKILFKEGDHINVGDSIIEISGSDTSKEKRPEVETATEKVETPPTSPTPAPTPTTTSSTTTQTQTIPEHNPGSHTEMVYAGPATRKLARELGIDLNAVTGSKRGGRIDQEDVKRHTKSVVQSAGSDSSGMGAPAMAMALPDFSEFGEIEIKKASNLRKTIANHITRSWQTIPHVHQFDEINIDEILSHQKEYKAEFKEKGSSLSVTIFIIKALAQALKEFPSFNSSYNAQTNEVIYKKYFNIGVAVDTPDGLIVPVLKKVNERSIFEIGMDLNLIAEKTRDRKIAPQDLKGASMTLSNLGGIGGTHFTPIINSPEVAILGTGRNYPKVVPSVDGKSFTSHQYLPICLAYDHRVIDGADGARFITYLKNLLEQPAKLFLIS